MRTGYVIALSCLLAPAAAPAEPVSVATTQVGRLTTSSSNCAPVYVHADATYESGVSWRTGGVSAPYYGAFAEQYEGTKSICAFVADLTQDGLFDNGQTADFYIWDNATSDSFDTPGAVLFEMHDVSPWPIGVWPEITRVVVPISPPLNLSGKWWVGIWGNWPGEPNAWYVAADYNGSSTHIPMTNIRSGGLPVGWQPVASVWQELVALGLGVEGTPLTPASVPSGSVELSSFGRVKSLYR